MRVAAAMPGLVITRYEIEPATGVKRLAGGGPGQDLARSLSLVSIRVVETIPGKNYMALELPNAKRQTIKLSEILGSQGTTRPNPCSPWAWVRTSWATRWWLTWPRCRMCWWRVPPVRASRGHQRHDLSLLYKAEATMRLLMIDPKMLEMSV